MRSRTCRWKSSRTATAPPCQPKVSAAEEGRVARQRQRGWLCSLNAPHPARDLFVYSLFNDVTPVRAFGSNFRSLAALTFGW